MRRRVRVRIGPHLRAALCFDDAVANTNFGRMLVKKGEKALAKRYLLKALSLAPDDEAARWLLTEL
jgi:hypothetical protein